MRLLSLGALACWLLLVGRCQHAHSADALPSAAPLPLPRPHQPAGFAFCEYANVADAEEASRRATGMEIGGSTLRVELAKGGFVSTSARGPPRRGGFRVKVYGLPGTASWQDLKDHMRSAGDIGFADMNKDGPEPVGLVDFSAPEGKAEALARLNGSTFTCVRGGVGRRGEGLGCVVSGAARAPPPHTPPSPPAATASS